MQQFDKKKNKLVHEIYLFFTFIECFLILLFFTNHFFLASLKKLEPAKEGVSNI